MTKKKRELIEILLDNVKPQDWPENAVYAAQDKETFTWGK
jgi:phenylpyruvate tautomerase PptA (4-oxalocrotonate tautomerase family)